MNRRTACLLALFTAIALSTQPALAETHRVGPPGEGDYPTIQEAMSACADGDTVLILPGTYTGHSNRALDPGTNNIVILPRDGRGSVTIDCEDDARCFHIHGGQDTTMVIQDIIIHDGGGGPWDTRIFYGGGVLIEDGSSAKIIGCSLTSCSAHQAGGAICVRDGSVVVEETSFRNCWGGYYGGAVSVENGRCDLRRCEFVGNWTRNGGGVSGTASDVHILDCEFEGNKAFTNAGATYLDGSDATIARCSFNENVGLGHGSVIVCESSSLECTHCTVNDNICDSNEGAQIELRTSAAGQVSFSRCTITGSEMWNHNPAGFIRVTDSEPLFEYCVLAFSLDGPVATVTDQSVPEFTRCVVYDIAGGDSLPGYHHDNLFTDPLFCDVYAENMDHCSNSPCLPENNPWGFAVGAGAQGCGSCDTVVEPMTWGTIKAMYR